MMSKEVNERLKRDTQDVSFRENTEEKVRELVFSLFIDKARAKYKTYI